MKIPVGASLLAKASEQSALQPNITTNSQAGSLPQLPRGQDPARPLV